jgi:glutaconyl-CoA/methylmalonyl-CoA decarboxylase subunit gamma
MKNYTITVNGTAYEVTVEESKGRAAQAAAPVYNTPAPQLVQAPTPVAQDAAPAPVAAAPVSGAAGSMKVNAPMPGKIIAIKVNIGQTVKRGEVILLLEAMKMENEIVASEAGTVATIDVSAGDMVEAGSLLVTLN